MAHSTGAVRVLHTIESSAAGGAERLALTLARGMAQRGFEPVFAAPGEGWLSEQIRGLGLELLPLPTRRRIDLRFLRWLLSALNDNEISIVHAHLMAMNLYGSAAARLAHIPCVATLHGKLYDLERRRRRLVYRLIGSLAARLVAVSSDLGEALTRQAGVSPLKISVIPNGVDLSRFSTSARQSRHSDAPRIISVGSLTQVKGHRFLIEALAIVRREFPAAELLIVGEGPCRSELEALCRERRLAAAVKFLGQREDLPTLLGSCDLFALPSLSEGQPLSLLEAMAAGLAVVATRVGGNLEVVGDGESGFLVAPASPAEMAARLGGLLREPALAHQMGLAGRRRVEAEFSLAAMLDRYEGLYRNLLAERPRRGRAIGREL